MAITISGDSPNFSTATVTTLTAPTSTITTLNAPSGVLATQNGMTGIAKAWVQFAGNATPTINASYNVSSITYISTGQWTVNFTTAMSASSYAVNVSQGTNSASNYSSNIIYSLTTTSVNVGHYEAAAFTNPSTSMFVSIFSN
jgi:hypothetical protein